MKKLVISTELLKPALEKLGQAISENAALPVLSNLLVRARAGEVELITSDLEITIYYVCSCECTETFELLIPFKFLQKIISLAGKIPLEIQLNSSRKAQIVGNNDIYQLNSLEKVDDYPKLPEIPKKNMLELDENFMDWLNKSMAAVSKDSSRPAMTKACLDFTADGITIVSTDAHSLFRHFFAIPSPGAEQVLISPKMAKTMEGFKKTNLYWHSKHVAFKADNITLIATRHNDKYPDYRVVIPNHPSNLPVNRNELISALRRVSLADDANVTVLFRKNDPGKVHLSAVDNELERKIEVSLAGTYAGTADALALNPTKLLTLLHQVDFDDLLFHIDTPQRAVLITSAEDPDYLGMLMPLIIS